MLPKNQKYYCLNSFTWYTNSSYRQRTGLKELMYTPSRTSRWNLFRPVARILKLLLSLASAQALFSRRCILMDEVDLLVMKCSAGCTMALLDFDLMSLITSSIVEESGTLGAFRELSDSLLLCVLVLDLNL